MIAERHSEIKPIVNSVMIHLADIVINPGRPEHRSGDARVDREFPGQNSHPLSTGQKNFILAQHSLELIEKAGKLLDHLAGLLHPPRWQVTTATPKAHIVAHHPR